MRGPHAHRPGGTKQPLTKAQEMRESLGWFPEFTQPVLTALTGLPRKGEKPIITWSPAGRAAVAFVTGTAAVLTASIAATHGGWAWLAVAPAELLVAGVLRWAFMVAGHFAAHRSLGNNNELLGEVATVLTMTLPHALYERIHALFHHSRRLATADFDVRDVLNLGFVPGTPLNTLRWRVLWTLLSPKFHARALSGRVKTTMTAPSRWRRVAAVGFHTGLLGAALATGLWKAYIFGWVLPFTFVYDVSSLLQLITEHRWFRKRGPNESMREHQAKLTFGRFLGDPLPKDGGANWVIWVIRLVFLHIPARLLVLVGDLPQHDLHHIRPRGDWANAAFTRRDLKDSLGDRWLRGDDDEITGSIFTMVDEVLRGISEMPPLTEEELEELRKPPR